MREVQRGHRAEPWSCSSSKAGGACRIHLLAILDRRFPIFGLRVGRPSIRDQRACREGARVTTWTDGLDGAPSGQDRAFGFVDTNIRALPNRHDQVVNSKEKDATDTDPVVAVASVRAGPARARPLTQEDGPRRGTDAGPLTSGHWSAKKRTEGIQETTRRGMKIRFDRRPGGGAGTPVFLSLPTIVLRGQGPRPDWDQEQVSTADAHPSRQGGHRKDGPVGIPGRVTGMRAGLLGDENPGG